MCLILPVIGPLPFRQASAKIIADETDLADLSVLVNRLSNRLGARRIYRAAPVESDVPERSVRRVPALSAATSAGWSRALPRPVHLLKRPQPVEALAMLPDHPPAQCLADSTRCYYQRRLDRDLAAIMALAPTNRHGKRLRKAYGRVRSHLFTFLEQPEAPPDNNASEPELRPTATYRKVTGGFCSTWGADLFAGVRSVVGTGARRGVDAYQAILNVLRGETSCTPVEQIGRNTILSESTPQCTRFGGRGRDARCLAPPAVG